MDRYIHRGDIAQLLLNAQRYKSNKMAYLYNTDKISEKEYTDYLLSEENLFELI